MTDKELLKQAYDALDKITDMFEAVKGRCVIGGDDVYYSAVKVMVKLNDRLEMVTEHEFVSVEKLKSMTINELVLFLYDGE